MLVQKRAVRQSMLDRIVMNVIDMPIHVILISNYMIPESSLPSAPARQIMSFAILGWVAHPLGGFLFLRGPYRHMGNRIDSPHG